MSQNAKSIIEGIREALNIKSDKQFCLMLGIKQNTLSTWKKRDTLDFNKIISFCEKNNLDLNEVFFKENDLLISQNGEGVAETGKTKVKGDRHTGNQVKVEKLKKVNLVNTNKEISFFMVQVNGKVKAINKIAIGQRTQLKKLKANSEVILVLKNKRVYLEKFKSFSPDFNRVIFDSTQPHSTLKSVYMDEIMQAHIHIGNLEESELNRGKPDEQEKMNQVLLLEKQIERLKKKFG